MIDSFCRSLLNSVHHIFVADIFKPGTNILNKGDPFVAKSSIW